MSSSVGGCHHKDVLRFKVIQILSLSDDDDAFPKLSCDNENNNTNTKKCKYIYAYTPETDRYFVDGNSKTQQKNLKNFFFGNASMKTQKITIVYVPKIRN